ncbi:MAG: hypothetical protein LUQ66_12825 [Methanoregula sp.]|nr:hypothetical protein [Methanoregula sp.]
MNKYPDIPELLEAYMVESATDERWVTAQELRNHFGLTRYQSNTVSAFLRRLRFGPFGRFPFIVERIEQQMGENPSDPKKSRYLLKRREYHAIQRKQIRQPEPLYDTQ